MMCLHNKQCRSAINTFVHKSARFVINHHVGPALVNQETGLQTFTIKMNNLFIELLSEIFKQGRDPFGIDIQSVSDIPDK